MAGSGIGYYNLGGGGGADLSQISKLIPLTVIVDSSNTVLDVSTTFSVFTAGTKNTLHKVYYGATVVPIKFILSSVSAENGDWLAIEDTFGLGVQVLPPLINGTITVGGMGQKTTAYFHFNNNVWRLVSMVGSDLVSKTYLDDQDSATLNASKAYSDSVVVGLWDDRGNFNASVNAYPSSGGSGIAGAIKKGDIWTVSVAGTLPTGQVVEVGDTVRALVDIPSNTQGNWAIAQNNIGYTAENLVNKSTSVTTDQASDVKYPSVKSVYDWAVSLFVKKNTAITGSTKTKITYDVNGLVTNGADATTADIADSINRRYVTDAILALIGTFYGTAINSFTSAQLATSLTNETGTGLVVFNTTPTFIGNIKGDGPIDLFCNPAVIFGGIYTSAYNLQIGGAPTDDSTLYIYNNPTAASFTKLIYIGIEGLSGSITNIYIGSSVIGALGTITLSQKVVLGSTINKLTITPPATSATLTIADGSSLITSGAFSITLIATANTNITLPTTGILATLTGTETLTNKRVTPRVGTTASSATPTINTDNVEYYEITNQTVDITGFTMQGTPTRGQRLYLVITGTASRAITWGPSFESSTIILPNTTVGTASLDVGFRWNVATSKWRCSGIC